MEEKELQALMHAVPRVGLATLPTPLHELRNLSKRLGDVRILVKRDDLTGLGLGGNKVRGLEFMVGEARRGGADVLITWGYANSVANHCRLTAAAAARAGMECEIVLGGGGFSPSNANSLLCKLLGARFRFVAMGTRDELTAVCYERADELSRDGHRPFVADEPCFRGAFGALGYVQCALELHKQLRAMDASADRVYVCSEGGTQAGLVLANKLLGAGSRVIGVAVTRLAPGLEGRIAGWAVDGGRMLGVETEITESDVENTSEFVGEGYEVAGDDCLEAIEMLGAAEGIILDPTYTGKAMAALIDHIRSGKVKKGSTVVFVHTGGSPLVFDYVDESGDLGQYRSSAHLR